MKMKKIAFFLLISLGLLSCSNNDDKIQNPYLVVPLVNLSLNLNLPEYTDLKFPGGSFIVNNQGIKGIVVYCVSDTQYFASELSDPNHSPNSCSKMEVTGIIATCSCDDGNTNDIITGQFTPPNNEKYPMLQYRAERNGDIVTVYN
ncbi:MAG: hypothetical protein HOF75_10790 [Flavobacteriaceae bacterium]|jgi:hypothetical protein|nr:hypothetical protein [Flavobacteriaceae bacterium]MBT3919872.1 hypothetical protein [Flavobacteriaceae bacterium]MBT6704940.1 hypothetical protein [Flavobacteriaceae bacterium]|tara:strand:- start:37 stop:474 length:438 start_codon:yes stop_codon:yes gene_type:complete